MTRELLIDRAIYLVDDATRTYRFLRRNPAGIDAATSNRNKQELIGYRRIMRDGTSKPFSFVRSRSRHVEGGSRPSLPRGSRLPDGPDGLRVGDEVLVVRSGHAPGARNGAGLVVGVVDGSGGGLYRVRWSDGVETIFRPGRDAVVRRGTGR